MQIKERLHEYERLSRVIEVKIQYNNIDDKDLIKIYKLALMECIDKIASLKGRLKEK